MIKRPWLRKTLGTILGACAGLSLTSSILPAAFAGVGIADSFYTRWMIGEYAAPAVLVWAVGGWAVARVGMPKAGMLILGLVGALSGLLISSAGFGSGLPVLATGGIAGAFYGLVGGLLLGHILQDCGAGPALKSHAEA